MVERQILLELAKDARATNRALAARVGVAESTSLQRIRDLTDRGVIAGVTAEIPPARLGRPVQAIIAVQLRPKSRQAVEAFRDWISARTGVLAVFVVAGSDDFLIHVCVPDPESLQTFVLDQIATRPHVADVRTSLVYQHLVARSEATVRLLEDLPVEGAEARHRT